MTNSPPKPVEFWDNFTNCVMRTASREPKISTMLLGLLGESGEVCDLVKKFTGHGRTWDNTRLMEELGDLLWYCGSTYLILLPHNDLRYLPEGKPTFSVYPIPVIEESKREKAAVQLCVELARVCYDMASSLAHYPEGTSIFKVEHILQCIANFESVVDYKPIEGGRFGSSFLGTLAEGNIAKLAIRYPDKFVMENEKATATGTVTHPQGT